MQALEAPAWLPPDAPSSAPSFPGCCRPGPRSVSSLDIYSGSPAVLSVGKTRTPDCPSVTFWGSPLLPKQNLFELPVVCGALSDLLPSNSVVFSDTEHLVSSGAPAGMTLSAWDTLPSWSRDCYKAYPLCWARGPTLCLSDLCWAPCGHWCKSATHCVKYLAPFTQCDISEVI